MFVPLLDLAPAAPGQDRKISALLEEGWTRGMASGAIVYDPDQVEIFSAPPLKFYFLPGREARPRTARAADDPPGLRRPHRPCPFDTAEFLSEREVFRVQRAARMYHLAFNKFPVVRLHYLAIRPASDAPDLLPQRLVGPEEVEDMVRLASMIGEPHHLFFNSNQGADGSRSGSSVNHWHFQIFPLRGGALEGRRKLDPAGTALETGRLIDWPAHHRLYRSREPAALAEALWSDVREIDARDRAYNLELVPRGGSDVDAILFPRAPVLDLALPGGGHLPGGGVMTGGGVLSADFGGIELSGGVVVPTRQAFDWIRARPKDAVDLILKRIEAGTREPSGS